MQPTTLEATEVATAPADNLPEPTVVVASPEQEEVVAAAAASEEPVEQEEQDDVPELEAQGENDSSDKEQEEEQGPMQSAKIARGILKPSRYATATGITESKFNSDERNKATDKQKPKRSSRFLSIYKPCSQYMKMSWKGLNSSNVISLPWKSCLQMVA